MMPCWRLAMLVVAAELLLEQAVDALGLLLLAKLHAVLRVARALLARPGPADTGALDAALVGVAAVALQEELDTFAAAQSAVRPGVTCHVV